MDCFVKGEYDNGFLSRPSVMLEVRSSRNVIHERRDEKAWPLPGTSWNQLYLGLSGLDGDPPTRSTELSYDCEYGRISLDYLFDQDTEVTGEMKLRLWVEARGRPGQSSVPHDLTLFVAIDKLGANGQPIRFNESIGYIDDWVTRGFCRVSRHALDPIHSKPWLPVYLGTSVCLLKPGEIVPVDIALYPSSTFFSAGESMRLVISSREIIGTPPY